MVNPITVNNFASLFNCTPVGRASDSMKLFIFIVLVNSRFGVFYSNFLSLTPTFYKVSIEKYSKTYLEDSIFTPTFKILVSTLILVGSNGARTFLPVAWPTGFNC